DHFAESGIVKLSVEPEARPDACNQHRERERIKLERFRCKGASNRECDCRHDKGGEQYRLKDRALRIFLSAAQLAPHSHCNAAEAGQAADQAVDDADAKVRWKACLG